MKGVADDVAILDVGVEGGQRFAVDGDIASLYGIFLSASVRSLPDILLRCATYVVLFRSVSELVSKDVQDASSSPSLFDVGVVCKVVWVNTTKAVLEQVWPGPAVAAGWSNNVWWSRHG